MNPKSDCCGATMLPTIKEVRPGYYESTGKHVCVKCNKECKVREDEDATR